jgi:hypothetical protein
MSSPEELTKDWRSNEGSLQNNTGPSLTEKEQAEEFDVFLCHNNIDKPMVRWIAKSLGERDILPWLDEDELPPGRSWQEELERQIEHIKAAAVFVGPNGFGPWQNREMRAFLDEFVVRQCPVIPVLLPGALATPAALPVFLKGLTWVDLREQDAAGIDRLVWGITGRKPRKK